ncbi:MAG: ATP-binding cassette domain-containing protein, partial [Chloroflexi bacterium]|nr:ATP-binding cassette domain-containing protein [Chloroflexota bacterium]
MVWRKKKNISENIEPTQNGKNSLIVLKDLDKVYHTDAGDFPALLNVDLEIGSGEFVSVIGKSGSGKTTLINMLTGIDQPSSGEIFVGGVAIHNLNEGEMAAWRGRNMGVVFQFFQLLPTLSVFQNVMIPMDFCNMFTPAERRERAMHLLELVDIAEHAHKLPSRLSGGQQQRAAIARALANDPPIICTDEPTGNLDSKTAGQIFDLFQQLVKDGKTILMVTHDDDLAKQASRTVIIADGEIVNEYFANAFPTLSHELMLKATKKLLPMSYAAGEPIILQGSEADRFYIVSKGEVEVYLNRPDAQEVLVDTLGPGQYFGEIALLNGGARS